MKNLGEDESIFIAEVENCSLSSKFDDLSVVFANKNNIILKGSRYGRLWAIKALSVDHRDQLKYQIQLKKEYDLLVSLNHQGIVDVFSYENISELGNVIVMEWIDGITLEEWLNSTPTPSNKRKIRILDQLLEVLSYIHKNQITHKDLKLTNILITRNGEYVKLIDFGLSDSDSYEILKQSGGSLGYIAPELLGKNYTDVRTDIYSLGCILKNMHLSKLYNGIISRCLCSEGKRYSNVDEIIRHVKFVKNIYYYLSLVVVGLFLILSIIGLSFYQLKLKDKNRFLQGKIDKINSAIPSIEKKIDSRNMERTYFFQDFYLAACRFCDFIKVYNKLKIGDVVTFEIEPFNQIDPFAVKVIWTDVDGKKYILGYIPRKLNFQISTLLNAGWDGLFSVYIVELNSKNAATAKGIKVAVYVNKRE